MFGIKNMPNRKFFKTKISKTKFLKVVGLIILIVSFIVGLVLVKENQDIRENASVGGCKYSSDRKSCLATCSYTSGNKCRWDLGNNKCEEGNKPCDAPWIPPQTSTPTSTATGPGVIATARPTAISSNRPTWTPGFTPRVTPTSTPTSINVPVGCSYTCVPAGVCKNVVFQGLTFSVAERVPGFCGGSLVCCRFRPGF